MNTTEQKSTQEKTNSNLVTINYKDLIEKKNIIFGLLNEKELQEGAMSKLKYAIQKWDKSCAKQIEEVYKKFQEKLVKEKTDIDIKYAKEDKGIIQKNPDGSYATPKTDEAAKVLEFEVIHKKLNEEMFKEEITFEPYFLVDESKIKNIDLFIQEELEGVFIKSEDIIKF